MTPLLPRILIVDDEPICRKMIQFALEQKGFTCDSAEDGWKAQQHLVQRQYDVVVTDLIMPRMNGGELIIKLCAERPRPIVVVHTSVLESEVAEGLRREGVDDIVYKPADSAKLADRIQTLVEHRLSHPKWSGRGNTSHETSAPTRPQPTLRLLARGDEWVETSLYRREVFRFGIVIVACLLFGLGWGQSLTPQMALNCKMFALCGLAFYFCLELVAYYREQNRAAIMRYAAERRLYREQSPRAGS